MNEFADAAKAGGNRMTIFGVIAVILGILAMLAPALTGMSVIILVGVLVLIGGIVRIIWALQAGSLGKGLLMFAIGGFALVAYPAKYSSSGIMTFIVNHDGAVYQKDLGKNTEKAAQAMKLFNPDSTWKKVE